MIGMATDGIRLSSDNLIIVVAPEEKRPIYMALQNNIVRTEARWKECEGYDVFISVIGLEYQDREKLMFIESLGVS